MNSDVEEIKSRLNIVDVLREYIRLEKAGANWRALCPFHNEKSPSFMVNEDKQMWHCFGCGKGGDIFAFIMDIEGLEFKDALKHLAEKAGVELKRTNPKLAAEKNKTLEILELATKFYQAHLLQTAKGKKIIDYLKARGLNDDSIKNFRLGYAPDGWTNALNFLLKKGFTEGEIAKTGLLVESQKGGLSKYYDRFRDRIMFPIADVNSKIVGFSARVAPGGDESQAKYVNTPETEVYHKSKILYGIDKAKQTMRVQDFALLVEGNMDVIAAAQAGLTNTVAVSGTALTAEQIGIIKRYAGKIKMLFDMDKAGEAATKKSIKLCFGQEIAVMVVELPEGKDAAELAQKDPQLLLAAVSEAKEAMQYFFDKVFTKYDKNKVADKKKIAEELLEMIDVMANSIEQSHWIKALAQELNLAESILTDSLKQIRLKERVTKQSQEALQESTFIPKGKSETLLENVIGLMLIYGTVWKDLAQKADEFAGLPKDSLLNILIARGEEFQYSFDNLRNHLGDPEQLVRLENIYFEKKYRLGLNNDLEEIVVADPWSEAVSCLKEMKKVLLKEELEKISRDLGAAEKSGDREAAQFLRLQVKRISSELTN